MVERDRRRREGEEREPARPEPAPPRTPAADILALQSTAGNQAVIQRLMYKPADAKLTVPATFANLKAKWNDETGHVDDVGEERTVYALWQSGSYKFRNALRIAIGEDALTSLQSVADNTLDAAARSKAENTNDPGLLNALGTTATAHNRLMQDTGEKYSRASFLKATSYLPGFKDLLPEAPDIPGVGVPLETEIPGTEDERGKRKTYWEYACVLIALYKNEGIDKARSVLGDEVEDDLHEVVQALHDKYVGDGIQYDDTATRMTVMRDWGYKMIFSGEAAWKDVSKTVNFSLNRRYIFDIQGHTVKVRIKQVPPKAGITDDEPASDYFEPESDPTNYSTSEFLKKVLGVWST